ncbi:Ubiquitin carboxyl-terminal hydrolase 36 [Hondaea fermentalgiana]|uniref:Ubiquitin carboxyl-terminal hydrolase n=1 Tax=Hondaea fermentalgiana TaxID=2315210 RepID=A0A2R5GCE3_9STRA|nr:Ubiquitin carboxyl-terminal hydrolase 36 [Hondaea fermentalgiana]|eukprot:GBG28647.1 Ubiquitin carboxyl-terminal hydrolase 36 [Hondaea fermentalgiana]
MLAAQIAGAGAPALPRRITFVPGRALGARRNLGSGGDAEEDASSEGAAPGLEHGPDTGGGAEDPGVSGGERARDEPPGFAALRKAGYEVHYVRTQSNGPEEARTGGADSAEARNQKNGDEDENNIADQVEARANNEFAKWEDAALASGSALYPAAEEGWSDRLAWKSVSAVGPGFHNLGNTCFLNSVLQCLTYLPGLAQLALETESRNLDLFRISQNARARAAELGRSDRYCALAVLTQHLRAIHTIAQQAASSGHVKKRQAAASPDFFVSNLRKLSKHMRVGRQQDAHEFLRVLLSNMQESCALAAGLPELSVDPRLRTTAFMRLFAGVLESRLTCGRQACGADTRTFESFLDLSLDVAHPRIKTIEDALRRFTANERLDQENQWNCPVCQKPSKAVKRLCIRRTPNQLVLHLKRFGFGARGRKVRKSLVFDRELNMGPYLVGAQSTDSAGENFVLSGIVVHVGPSVTSGHYIAFVRASNGLWYQMNDDVVRQVSFSTVKEQQAYLMFYSRKPSAPEANGDTRSKGAVLPTEEIGEPVVKSEAAAPLDAPSSAGGLASFAAAFAASADKAPGVEAEGNFVRSDLFGDFLSEEHPGRAGPETSASAEDTIALSKAVNRPLPGYFGKCFLKNPARTSRVAREVFLAYHLVPNMQESKRRRLIQAKETSRSRDEEVSQPAEEMVSDAKPTLERSKQHEASFVPDEDQELDLADDQTVEAAAVASAPEEDDIGAASANPSVDALGSQVAWPKRPRHRPSAGDEVVVLEASAHRSKREQKKGNKDAWAAKVRDRNQEVRKLMREKRKSSAYDHVDAALDRGRQKKVKTADPVDPRKKNLKGKTGNAFQRVQSGKLREQQAEQRKKKQMFQKFVKTKK